jgi:RNA polymerase sigma-70 factor (ECF subfamily)
VPPSEVPRPTGSADEDQALVERARHGDEAAFGALVRAYQHRVVNFARAMVGDAMDAEDVAQDAFLRAWRGLGGFRGGSSFKTWLYQIVTNTARTHRTKRQSRPDRATGDTPDAADVIERLASPDNPEAEAIRRDAVDQALQALPEDWRAAVVLRDVEGLDYAEIARALAIPIGTVESRIFRGRARLRALVANRRPRSFARGERS